MPAPSTTAEFLELLNKSGLKPPGSFDDLPGVEGDPTKLAAALVRRGELTPFQAKLLLSGRYRGFRLGPYAIRDQIGHGGMGAVYLAEHTTLRKLVAIKVLSPGEGTNKLAVERFLREARSAARLDHPNIVRTFDVGDHRDTHYIVMEYVDGQTLDKLVQLGGPLACGRAVEYVAQAAAGLQHAYEQGIIHRDIKPANMILAKDGTLKLLDMGLARSFDDTDKLTEQLDKGAVVGTADYISPEQAMSAPNLDIRSDIYSLGATFFTLVTGRPPFEGTTTQKLVQHQMKAPPSLSAIDKTFPPGLSAVIGKMLAKKPADRFQTPAEVIAALGPWVPKSRHVMAGLSRTNLDHPQELRNTLDDVAMGGTKRMAGAARPRPKWVLVAAGIGLAAVLGLAAFLAVGALTGDGETPSRATPPGGTVPTQPEPDQTVPTQPSPKPPDKKPVEKKPAETKPPAPSPKSALSYELALAGAKPFSEHGKAVASDPANPAGPTRWVTVTKTGDAPLGWRAAAAAPETEVEFQAGPLDGKAALGVRGLSGTATAVLVTPDAEFPSGRGKLKIEYRTEAASGAVVVKGRAVKPTPRPAQDVAQLPATNGAWATELVDVDLKGATAAAFEVHATSATPGRFSVAGFAAWDAAPAPDKGLLRLDLGKQLPFVQRAAKEKDPAAKVPIAIVHEAGDGKMPPAWYRWIEHPDGVVEYFADGPPAEPALGFRNVGGTPGMMLTSPEFTAPVDGRCRVRLLYQTGPDSPGFVLRLRPMLPERKPSWDVAKLPPTGGSWRLVVLDFDTKGTSRGLFEFYNAAPGEGGAVRLREVTVTPAR
jgi:serine/threonine protein kinase